MGPGRRFCGMQEIVVAVRSKAQGIVVMSNGRIKTRGMILCFLSLLHQLSQSGSRSLRYPCPAERINEDFNNKILVFFFFLSTGQGLNKGSGNEIALVAVYEGQCQISVYIAIFNTSFIVPVVLYKFFFVNLVFSVLDSSLLKCTVFPVCSLFDR